MTIRTTCPGCSASLNAPDHAAGKPRRCPECGKMLQVPHQSDEGPVIDMGTMDVSGVGVADEDDHDDPSEDKIQIGPVTISRKRQRSTTTRSSRQKRSVHARNQYTLMLATVTEWLNWVGVAVLLVSGIFYSYDKASSANAEAIPPLIFAYNYGVFVLVTFLWFLCVQAPVEAMRILVDMLRASESTEQATLRIEQHVHEFMSGQ